MRIDSHLHFWKHETGKRNWITDEMSLLQKDYLPESLHLTLQQLEIESCIAIQSQNDELENDYLLQLAEANPFIKGVVCWTDLQANDVEEKLVQYKRNPIVKGFRHITATNESIMLRPSFRNGVELLSKSGFTYDILANTEQLRYAYQLAAQLPHQKFVIDHAGKPPVGSDSMADWKRNIGLFSPLENVYCKIPGISVETADGAAALETITPYLDVLVDTFGTGRLLFGSNWPVCLLKTDYEMVVKIAASYFESFSADEQEQVFAKNAMAFYNF